MDKDEACAQLSRLSFSGLPSGWVVEQRYDTSVYVSHEESGAHVVVQVWEPEGNDSTFAVRGMTPTGRKGVSEGNKNTTSGHESLSDAKRVAIQMVNKFDELYADK